MKLEMKNNNKKFILMSGFMVITIVSILLRLDGMEVISGDFVSPLNIWFNILKESGGLLGLKLELGDYNIPYMIILAILTYLPVEPLISIKIVSIVFDYVMAFAVAVLVIKLSDDNKDKYCLAFIAYTLTVLLPTFTLNSAFWAQCDSIYASFAIISLIYLIDEKYFRSFIFLGVSFAFKLQFIFIIPVYILVYLSKRKFPIYYFLILPIIDFVMCLPAMIYGRSIISCISIYFAQTTRYNNRISLNFPGIYNMIYDYDKTDNVIYEFHSWMPKVMVIFTLIIFAIVALYVIVKKLNFSKKMILNTAIWSILISTFFLPYMHERYIYMAEVLSIVYFIANRIKENICYDRIANLFYMHLYGIFVRSQFGSYYLFIVH